MKMPDMDTQKIEDILRACAEKYIIPRFRALEDHHIRSKTSPRDLVTVADIEAEEALDEILSREFPGSVVVGEEAVSSGAKPLSLLRESAGMIWVVDPVDGTNNFVRGQDEFCTMLACVVDGRTRHGWIYDIPGGRFLYARDGGGVTLDGAALRFGPGGKALSGCVGFAGRGYFHPELRPLVDDFRPQVAKLYSLGCAGHEYLRVLGGQADFGIYSRVRPWDHLVGTLAVVEAGGVVRKWDGGAYLPDDYNGGIAVASDAVLYDRLDAAIIAPLVQADMRAASP